MPTRRQTTDDWQFKQNAFASSAEYDRGILANLLAARCQKLTDRETISVLWWLQRVSWREGALEKFARDFLESHAHLIGTPSMLRFGVGQDQIYNADQVRAVRREMFGYGREFPLQGEKCHRTYTSSDRRQMDAEDERAREVEERYPTTYKAKAFVDSCELSSGELTNHLKRILVDPETDPTAGLWNMRGLWQALVEVREKETNAASHIVETEVTRRVYEELDYALEARTFVLIEGREGIGKTEAARAWCAQRPGKAIYLRIESGVDETTLYRSIARQIGVSCTHHRKAAEMRARIEDALQPGHLLLCIDEAHFLFPSSSRCERTAPKRIDWLRTALVDFDVPVALISTPQYFARACERFRKGCGWNSLQIQRRLARTVVLPEPKEIPIREVLAVARSYFGGVNERELKLIAGMALQTVGFLTAIKHLKQRFDFLVSRRRGMSASELLAEVLREAGLCLPEAQSTRAPIDLKGRLTQPQNTLSAPRARGESAPGLIVQPETATV